MKVFWGFAEYYSHLTVENKQASLLAHQPISSMWMHFFPAHMFMLQFQFEPRGVAGGKEGSLAI